MLIVSLTKCAWSLMVTDTGNTAGSTPGYATGDADTGDDAAAGGTTTVPTHVYNALMKNRSTFKLDFKYKKFNGRDEQDWFRFKKN